VTRRTPRLLLAAAIAIATLVAGSAPSSARDQATSCPLPAGFYSYSQMLAAGCDVEPVPSNPCPPLSSEDAAWGGFSAEEVANGYADAAVAEADSHPPLDCEPDPRDVFYGVGVRPSRPVP
jgi:hypothetical protein